MNFLEIMSDIAHRNNGDCYIGVVGPVRVGKSTFIKRFMEKAVIPYITDEDDKKTNYLFLEVEKLLQLVNLNLFQQTQ